MKLSTTINSWDLIGQKNFFEKIMAAVKRDSFEYIPKLIKQNKLDGVELVLSVNVKKIQIKQLKKILKSLRIPVLSIHQPLLKIHKIDLKTIHFLFEAAVELSAKLIVIHLFALQEHIFEDKFVKELKTLEKRFNVSLALENSSNNFFTGPFTGATRRYCWEDREFSKILKEKNFNITFDTTHMGQTGCNILDFYRENKDRIINVHLSDYRNNLLGAHLPLGKGKLPIIKLLQLMRKYKYNGIITLEVMGKGESVSDSIEIVRRVFFSRRLGN